MATIKSGTYRFNDLLTEPNVSFTQNITFECEGFIIDWIYITVNPSELSPETLIVIYKNADFSVQVYSGGEGCVGWLSADYGEGIQTVTITEDTEVSEEFYAWFTENSIPISAAITYNGKVISNIAERQTATLRCAGMKMESDVVVETFAGYGEGKADGYTDGYGKGKIDGYNEGFEAGKAEGGDIPAEPALQEATFTENGEYLPDEGYDGFSRVTVDVQGGTSEPIILTPSVTLADTSAMGGEYESGLTVDNGSWTFEDNIYTVYGYSLSGCKKLKFSGAFLHNGISSGTVRENILFVTGFKNDGGGVGVVGSTDIEVTPETYDVNSNKPYECVITVPDNADGVYFSCTKGGEPTLEVIGEKSYDEGKADGITEGIEQGRQDMNTAMMNAITCNGTKTEYRYAFWGEEWNDELFKPNTVIKPGNFQNGLYKSIIEYGAYTDLLDFSNCQNLSAAFMYSTVKKLKIIDARKTTSGFNGMANIFNSCTQLESIDEFYPSNASSKAVFNGTFSNCSALTKLIFKSEISQDGLDLHWSTKLSKESIESIINALSTTTSGLTVTLSKVAVDKACAEAELSNSINSTNSAWWAWLIGTKPNWTISLV